MMFIVFCAIVGVMMVCWALSIIMIVFRKDDDAYLAAMSGVAMLVTVVFLVIADRIGWIKVF